MNEILFNVMLVAIGWLNGLFLGWFILGKKKQIRIEDSVGKNLGQVPPQRNPPPPLIPTSWVLPPHYFPTIKKKLQMKPFDLEAAKRGEPLYTMLNGTASFVGLKKNGNVVLEYDNWIESRQQNEVFMAPKKRTVWVNLYELNRSLQYQFTTKKEADEYDRSGVNRIGGKAYPVEIEE